MSGNGGDAIAIETRTGSTSMWPEEGQEEPLACGNVKGRDEAPLWKARVHGDATTTLTDDALALECPWLDDGPLASSSCLHAPGIALDTRQDNQDRLLSRRLHDNPASLEESFGARQMYCKKTTRSARYLLVAAPIASRLAVGDCEQTRAHHSLTPRAFKPMYYCRVGQQPADSGDVDATCVCMPLSRERSQQNALRARPAGARRQGIQI
ncbi:hypothetical protein DFH09DRAFT_1086747 [Mycena vulgaris]|nr:hypothetical protein DFH09DRAFT_1086747 [Mycena vulgaris]